MFIGYLDTPIGLLKLTASEEGLRKLSLVNERDEPENENQFVHFYKNQLKEYFAGERTEFNQYFDLNGSTDFYKSVWAKLSEIPFGESVSYRKLAEAINNVNAVRAVGMANARNPIPIIIPCHRVIGSDGSLTGYALGLSVKRRLLIHEKILPAELF
jgi:methylated-DNA-[protein]-cysteine S-methyltransferase